MLNLLTDHTKGISQYSLELKEKRHGCAVFFIFDKQHFHTFATQHTHVDSCPNFEVKHKFSNRVKKLFALS